MVEFKTLQPGDELFSVRKRKFGNTIEHVHEPVVVESIDLKKMTIVARKSNHPARTFRLGEIRSSLHRSISLNGDPV